MDNKKALFNAVYSFWIKTKYGVYLFEHTENAPDI